MERVERGRHRRSLEKKASHENRGAELFRSRNLYKPRVIVIELFKKRARTAYCVAAAFVVKAERG
eukprot:12923772-Prorocentrum_lima.AAC.1